MTTDVRNLALQLRAWSEPIASGYEVPAAARTLHAAADALEALAGEVERLKEERGAAITDRFDAAADRIKVVAAERDRLKAALGEYAHNGCEGWCRDAPAHAFFDDCGGCPARKALGGDA